MPLEAIGTGEDRPWHATPSETCLQRLGVAHAGLTEAEAETRLRRFGGNRLPERPPVGWLVLFTRQFVSPLIVLLLLAAAVSLALAEVMDATFILMVLLINAVIGTIQEGKAERGAAALNRLVRLETTVVRDGARRRIDAAALVPGDIVELESGASVPADIRLLAATELTADEALLTGESLPVDKNATAIVDPDALIADRATMLHAGSLVLRGRATGVVVATGLDTQIGRIAAALDAGVSTTPPLILRLRQFSRTVGVIVVLAVAVLAAIQIALGTPLADVFFVAVALAVSAVPEGLPIAITVALAVAARRMAQRNVIVRSLPTVEGLGACTLIASDKTGTLTLNQLTASIVWTPTGGRLTIDGAGPPPSGNGRDNVEAVHCLATSGALCNEASFQIVDGHRQAVGDTVDVAFLILAAKLGLEWPALVAAEPIVGTIPYEPQRRYAAAFTRKDGRTWVHVKGAVETVLAMCRGDLDATQAAAEALAEEGHRVLAVARRALPPGTTTTEVALRDLDFLGLVGLIDPVRPEAPAAVQAATEAGVRVCMVTGDHPTTALAIARTLELAATPADVVTGRELAAVERNPERHRALVAARRIFARVEPLQKLRIVEALQDSGHFVAVTGDGVNDAPALYAAHIGVAMGRGGTDVARRAADLIVTDDNFASIVAGIGEGRIAYANIRKVIYFLISTSIAEIALFFLCLLGGLPLPFFAVQLLWLNLVTDSIQHIALSFEREEADAMTRGPRPPDESLFDRRMVEQTLLAGATMGVVGFAAFDWLLSHGWSVDHARNLLLLLFVCFENVHVFNCRSERRSTFRLPIAGNPLIPLVVVLAQAVHVTALYTPGLNGVLGVAPVTPLEWIGIAGPSGLLLAVVESYKLMRRDGRGRNGDRSCRA